MPDAPAPQGPVTVKIGAAHCPVCLAAAKKLNDKLLSGALPTVPRDAFGTPRGGMGAIAVPAIAGTGNAVLVAYPEAVQLCTDPSTWDPDTASMWRAFQGNPAGFAASGFAPLLHT